MFQLSFRLSKAVLFCSVLAIASSFFPAILSGQAPTPYILWPAPMPLQFLSPLTSVQLNAVALAGKPVGVSLAASYNVAGIATPGKSFAGGFDGNGESFSAAELGSSIQWKGITFALGPPDAPDVVSGGSVLLPAGSYSTLLLLADLVNDPQPGTGTITVHYTDGSSSTTVQAFSDWVRARNNSGESTVACVASRVFFNGSLEPNSTCIYGYQIALDASKTVVSVDLPSDRNIVVLSMALVPPVLPGTLTYSPAAGTYPPVGTDTLHVSFTPQAGGVAPADTSVSLVVNPPSPAVQTRVLWPAPAPVSVGTALDSTQLNARAVATASPVAVDLRDAARVNAFFNDGTEYRATGFDGQNEAYSYQQLGSTLHYQGASFALGAPDVQNAASNNTIRVPSGNYTALQLIGAASQASPGQIFQLQYADGTTTQQTMDLSSWTATSTYANETVVAVTNRLNLSDGGQRSAQARVYGYTLPVDASRMLVSITLPPNPAVVILGAALSTGADVPVDGTFAYSPAAGTVLAQGTTALHVDFSPADAADFTPAQGDTSITALRAILSLRANNATRAYGDQNPAFTGTITGQLGNDTFVESFTTLATVPSAPGTYAIVPAASGARLSGYTVQVSPGTLTVTQAAATVALSLTPKNFQGSIVTLSATVASTTSGVPTGRVTFVVNGTPFASADLVQGTATLATSSLPVGSVGVVASYEGDTNFLPGTSAPSAITVGLRDFALTSMQVPVLKGMLGSNPSFLFHVAPLDGSYSAKAVFSVEGPLPLGTYATFSPETIAPDGGPQDVTLTLHTSKFTSLQQPGSAHASLVSLAILLGILPIAALRRKHISGLKRSVWMAVVAFALLASATGLTGCGSGYAGVTYPFTLSVTTGQVSHSMPLTLLVQATPQ